MNRSDSLALRVGALIIWTVSARQSLDLIEAAVDARWLGAAWLAVCLFGSIYVGRLVWRTAR